MGRSTKRIRIEIFVTDDLGAGEKRKQVQEFLSGNTKLVESFRLLGWNRQVSPARVVVS